MIQNHTVTNILQYGAEKRFAISTFTTAIRYQQLWQASV
jgi:hypothetical protein